MSLVRTRGSSIKDSDTPHVTGADTLPGPARLGGTRDRATTQDPRGVSPMPRSTGTRPPTPRRSLESHVHRKMPAWFGEQPCGKDLPRQAPAVWLTRWIAL